MDELEQAIVLVLTAARSDYELTRLRLIDMLLQRLDFLKAIVANLDKEQVLELVSKLYDDYIAPFDIPGIPNLIIEPQIDAALKGLVLAIVAQVIDKAKSDAA